MEDPNMTISGPEVRLSPVAGDLLMVLLELPVHNWVLLPRLQLGLTRQSQQSTLTSPHKLIKSGKFGKPARLPYRKIKSVTLVIGAIEKLKLIVLPQIFNLRSDKSRQFFMIKTG